MKKRLEEKIVKGQPIKLVQRLEMKFADTSLRESLKSKNEGIKLTESTGGQQKRKLIVTVEGIHTGLTKNLTFYPGDTLEASVPTWTAPHYKPVLKNHNEYSEPLGRIVHAEYVESTLAAGKYTVRLKLEITDQDAIDKVLDGRYLTLSVGGSANKVVCSTCGRNLVAEGFCGHWRGKKYEGKSEPTHWIIGEYTGDEISFVNMPADVYSQVIAAELVTGEGGKNVKTGNKASAQAESTEDLLDTIDNLTESAEDDDDFEDEIPVEESEESEEDNDGNDNSDVEESADGDDAGEGDGDGEDAGDAGDESVDERIKQLEQQLAEKDQRISELEAENATLTSDLSEANQRAETLQNQLTEAEQNLSSAEEEARTFREQSIKLARFSKKLLAERVVDLRIMHGKDKAEDRESLIESWMQSTPKVLESTIQDLLKGGHRQIPQVTSPGLAVHDQNSVEVDGELTESTTATKPKKPLTLADLEEQMVKTMSQRI